MKAIVFVLTVFLLQCTVSSSSVVRKASTVAVSAAVVVSLTRTGSAATAEGAFDDAIAATTEHETQVEGKQDEILNDHGHHNDQTASEDNEPGFWERMFPENHHADTLDQLKKNPIVVILIIAFAIKYLLSWKKMEHVDGSLVRHVNSVADWNVLMDESKSSGKFLIADFYATWCPPCRQAAPKFDQMSIEYGESANVIFCKVDVDKVESVAKSCAIQAMPTFLLVKDAKEVRKHLIMQLPAHTPARFQEAPPFSDMPRGHSSCSVSHRSISHFLVAAMHASVFVVPCQPSANTGFQVESME